MKKFLLFLLACFSFGLQAQVPQAPETPADQDREFDEGSRITETQLRAISPGELEKLCLVWGFRSITTRRSFKWH